MTRSLVKRYLIGLLVSIGIGFGTYHLAVRWIPPETWKKTQNSIKSFFVAQKEWFKKKTDGSFLGGADSESLALPSPSPSPSISPSEVPVIPNKPKIVGTTGGGVGSRCAPAEFRGESLNRVEVDLAIWSEVMDEFHNAKEELQRWLGVNRSKISPRSYEVLKNQVSEIKIQRPPTPQAADLTWRGIGVYVIDAEKGPMIRIGGGLLALVSRDKIRSQFELTRLIAQVWAPCELKRVGVAENIWGDLITCLKVTESDMCAEGSFSEAGWAVSSTLAYAISPPRCKLPVFQKDEYASCLSMIAVKKERKR